MTRLALAFASVLVLTRLARAEEPTAAEHEHGRGPWDMRVSVESPLYTHGELSSTSILDETELEPDVMIAYVLEEQRISFDLELGEGFIVYRLADSLSGGDAPNPFQEQAYVLATGLLFHLPG